ncbi:MAG TPA: tetratricopeptide repeat protein, partial [Bryobacteraceae bacterium]|nr:tetratricopeptide repeat protein [Bryobacteraceae bacterium]
MLRDYPAASETHLRAIRIRERCLGPMDPDLLANLDGLSYALLGQKEFEAAEPVYLRLLALWENNAGTHHPMVALTLDKLVMFYREWGREEPAEAAAARAAALRVHFHAAGLVKRAGEWQAAGD